MINLSSAKLCPYHDILLLQPKVFLWFLNDAQGIPKTRSGRSLVHRLQACLFFFSEASENDEHEAGVLAQQLCNSWLVEQFDVRHDSLVEHLSQTHVSLWCSTEYTFCGLARRRPHSRPSYGAERI